MNEHESQALWKIYSRVGIAVQSTFARLTQSFNEPDEKVYVSEVEYVNYLDTPIRWDADDWVLPSLSKRQQFEYERELRAVVVKPPLINGELNTQATDHPKGCVRGVDLRTLIERVNVAPGRRAWFESLTRSILTRYGYGDIPVVPSELDALPHMRTWDGKLLSEL